MTIEELTGMSADELEKLTDAQVLQLAKDEGWLNITRPELAPKPDKASSVHRIADFEYNAKVGKAKEFAKKWGMDLDGLFDD